MTAFTFVKAVKRQEKLRLALDGPAGSGKTWTALIIATFLAREEGGRIAVIDSERSSARKYATDFDFDHLTLPDFNPHTYIAAVRSAVAQGYPVIIIDSFSHAWEGLLQFKDDVTARSKSHNSYTEGWREATPLHNELVDTVLRADAHVIATLRTKTEYVINDGKPTKVGMKPIQRDGVDFEFDVVGDMTAENSLVVSKTRCSALAGQVIRKPDERVAQTLWEWLNDGEEMLGPAEVEAIKDALNAAGQPARKAWLDQFGMKPDDLPAARRDEAMAFIDGLDKIGAGAEPHTTGMPQDAGDAQPATSPGDEPGPKAAEAPAPNAQTSFGDNVIDARAIGIRAPKVFDKVIDRYPDRKKSWVQEQLRHALAYLVSNGKAASTSDLNGDQLLEVWRLLNDIEAGSLTFTFSADPAHGCEFLWDDGTTKAVMWAELTLAEAS